MRFVTSTVGAALLLAAAPAARQAPIVNGQLSTQPGAGLPAAVQRIVQATPDVAWIAYTVPAVPGDRTMCCFDSGSSADGGCCGMCRLEAGTSGAAGTSAGGRTPAGTAAGAVALEPADGLVVLLRVAERRVERIRSFSHGCRLDAGGRPVVWLEGVDAAESVALLEALVNAGPERRDRIADGAVAAIALHRGDQADAALERFLAPDRPASLRGRIPFWLGTARGARGAARLQRLVNEDPSADVRKKAVFGISQGEDPKSADLLIALARTHQDAAIRGEAIFWLAHKAGEKSAPAITERIAQDPDTEVKKRAVFALSQLPRDQGVPLLIDVARTHANAAVRKQAMFWLGQSRDPRALEFFADVLK